MEMIKRTIMIIATVCSITQAGLGPYDWAYAHLNNLRDNKVVQLRIFCDKIQMQARNAAKDQAMTDFFDLSLRFSLATSDETLPPELAQKISQLNTAFQEHYIRNWLSFYDILFIDSEGEIFYSIRKEDDFRINIINNPELSPILSDCIKTRPIEEVYLDFHYYGASDEAASFFVEPVFKDNVQIGWIAMQLAINKINSIFANTETLGQSSETFLVNRQGYMLTESNFIREDTILKTKLDKGNIEPKFQERRGNRFVTDYRGFKVLTSFEVFDFAGIQWLVVAKIDQAQITTEHYQQHHSFFNSLISDYLNSNAITEQHGTRLATESHTLRQVDMDEFIRADHKEMLQTIGVSTCTAVIAMYPGKFGYLAHVSPLDKVYGGDSTDLVGSITERIKTYDIYKYERPYVKFVIVAKHLNSLNAIVDKLVAEGFLLSQISIMYYPQARHARVIYDYTNDQLAVEWLLDQETNKSCFQNADFSHNIGSIVKQCIEAQDKHYLTIADVKQPNNTDKNIGG
ncbi:MAG: cache domain-containing protein [Sedimentisphaerales bacterium]|nr:cache domain-containing protein [Sedimentisphaerales bacterium]MBN2843530.1 cache domain-containing protein [Sedimentisphaerales bacterium]